MRVLTFFLLLGMLVSCGDDKKSSNNTARQWNQHQQYCNGQMFGNNPNMNMYGNPGMNYYNTGFNYGFNVGFGNYYNPYMMNNFNNPYMNNNMFYGQPCR